MKKVNLIFGIHWHFLAGQTSTDFEEEYQRLHKPFISSLYECENLPFTLYYAGQLLEYLEEKHPEYINLLEELLKRGQIEFLCSGFAEPALPLIPLIDKIGQIEKHTTYLRIHFGRRPRGFWLPEMVWEPNLPSILKSCGIDYTFLNDYVFSSTQRNGSYINLPYLTEDAGKTIVVFPLISDLSKRAFEQTPEETLERIKLYATDNPQTLACVLIEGENFKVNYKSFPKKKIHNWLKRFNQLLKKDETVKPILPANYLKEFTVEKKLYFPTSADYSFYQELWPKDKNYELCYLKKQTLPAINFKQVFLKNVDTALLYSRMMYTHLLVHQMRGDKARKKAALEELWKGQALAGYKQGLKKNLFNNPLRKELYRNLISAEKISRLKGNFLQSTIKTDFDFDGQDELIFQSNDINAYIHLTGGMLFELDYLPLAWNYLDTISDFGSLNAKQSFGSNLTYLRKAFIDHLGRLIKKPNSEELNKCFLLINSLSQKKYKLISLEREKKFFVLECQTNFALENQNCKIKLVKRFAFKKNNIIIEYSIKNLGAKEIVNLDFGCELNIGFLSAAKEYLKILDCSKKNHIHLEARRQERHNLRRLMIEDRLLKAILDLTVSEPAFFLNQALFTKENEKEKKNEQFQQMLFFFCWPLKLKQDDQFNFSIELSLQKL